MILSFILLLAVIVGGPFIYLHFEDTDYINHDPDVWS